MCHFAACLLLFAVVACLLLCSDFCCCLLLSILDYSCLLSVVVCCACASRFRSCCCCVLLRCVINWLNLFLLLSSSLVIVDCPVSSGAGIDEEIVATRPYFLLQPSTVRQNLNFPIQDYPRLSRMPTLSAKSAPHRLPAFGSAARAHNCPSSPGVSRILPLMCKTSFTIPASQTATHGKARHLGIPKVDYPWPPSGQAAQSLQPVGNLVQDCQSWVWQALCGLILA